VNIIKRGTPADEAKFIGVCTKCGSVLEAFRREVRMVVPEQPGHSVSYHGDCPVCPYSVTFFPSTKEDPQ
jgi:hypothetical protein